MIHKSVSEQKKIKNNSKEKKSMGKGIAIFDYKIMLNCMCIFFFSFDFAYTSAISQTIIIHFRADWIDRCAGDKQKSIEEREVIVTLWAWHKTSLSFQKKKLVLRPGQYMRSQQIMVCQCKNCIHHSQKWSKWPTTNIQFTSRHLNCDFFSLLSCVSKYHVMMW